MQKIYYKEVIKIIHKNKIIVRDYNNSERELLITRDRNTYPTQTDSVTLSRKINPKGIRAYTLKYLVNTLTWKEFIIKNITDKCYSSKSNYRIYC